MLYINTVVNGHPVKAFVDSGAQTTIMSPSCAEACGIMRLIDKRYSGVARGVGTAKILGRVHSADIKIGNAQMPCSFTVMEGKDVDLLLGLDMLKRHQASIDLKRNKLVFENNEVDFLPEREIPRYFEDAEPTIKGPNGTEIGAKSGTVKPAGTGAAASSSSAASGSSFRGSGQTLGGGVTGPTGPAVRATPGSSQPRPQPQPQPQRARHSPEKIEQLQGLGFTRDQAVAALDATDGNVEYAAGLLFQG
ncbi:DNA damage-inducible protein 1 [Taxawa tesnikishii (nom. ined.)]|nr:DNA damage-inducible protein 1 [Dothideales sp. JES 119]